MGKGGWMEKVPRILVADDEPKIRQILKKLLEREGYEAATFGDGRSALEDMVRHRPDLLITDLKMPGMDGLELLRRARSIEPELPVVLITGYASMETAVQALRDGVDDYITKPFSIDELNGVVGRILKSRALASENARLLEQLRVANRELEQHRQRLTVKVRMAESDLSTANEVLERRLRDMEVLHEIGQVVATVFDRDELLSLATQLIRDKVGTDASAVLLLDEEAGALVAYGTRGLGAGFVNGDWLPSDSGLLAAVVDRSAPLLVPSLADDDRATQVERGAFGGGSFLAAPLRGKDRPAGVLAVARAPEREPLTGEEGDLLELIANDLSVAIENVRLFEENERNYIDILSALVTAMEARDAYLRQHSERVKMKALELGRALNLSAFELDVLEIGARLHDLGKVGIEDRILHKPTSLDETEMSTMRSHPVIGDQIVKPLGKLGAAKPIIRNHHEHWDGTGYPDGLAGEDIPLLTQIVTLADAFDALTSRRSYREALPRKVALQILQREAGRHFNPFLVELLTGIETDRLRRHGRLGTGREAS